jgi:hypothetical protein
MPIVKPLAVNGYTPFSEPLPHPCAKLVPAVNNNGTHPSKMARKCDMISPYEFSSPVMTRMPSLWHPRLMLDKSSSGYDHNDGISLMINRIIWRLGRAGRLGFAVAMWRGDIGTSVSLP